MDHLFARSNLGLASAGAIVLLLAVVAIVAPLAYWRSRLAAAVRHEYAQPRSLRRLRLPLSAAAFFLVPLYVMLSTSFKSMDEIRAGSIFALPLAPSLDAWRAAWARPARAWTAAV